MYVTVVVPVLFCHSRKTASWSGAYCDRRACECFFDYFFLAVCGMEIEGAAIATGIGQMIPAVVGTVYFFFFKGELHFVPFHFHGATLKSCLVLMVLQRWSAIWQMRSSRIYSTLF